MNPVKFIFQVAVIFGCTLLGELAKHLLPFEVPSCIYGMAVLFALLYFRVLKPKYIRETSYFLISLFPLMFVAPAVGVSAHFSEFGAMLIPVCCAVFFTTILCAVLTGKVSQKMIQRKARK